MVTRLSALATSLLLGGCGLFPGASGGAEYCPGEFNRANAWATKNAEGLTTHVLVQFDPQDTPLQLLPSDLSDEARLMLELTPSPDASSRGDFARYSEALGASYAGVDIVCGGALMREINLIKQVR
ncbi:MAG: hypothetical protein AAF719_06265 [Pseudomonadota bacterium]